MDLPLPISLINWIGFAIIAGVFALTAIGFKPLIAFIKANLNAKIYGLLRSWALTYVTALYQDPTLKGLASEEKKQRAMFWLLTQAQKASIPLSTDEASNLIEEAVYLTKSIVLKEAIEHLSHPIYLK